jgi:hypothetical protein
MSDPWTAAWEEAEATAPPGKGTYLTIELIHPAFIEEAVPFSVRAVSEVGEDVQLTLEVGAPLNSGELVTFKAIPFFAERPEFEEGKTPTSEVSIDNVAREMIPYLENAVSTRANMILLYREWREDDTSAPCYGPIEFVLKRVRVLGSKVTGVAMIDDLVNKKFPNLFYTLNRFPGLRP